MTHIKAVGAVFGADGPTSPMMQHSPMNTIIVLVSAALGSLYIQTLAMLLVLLVYLVFFSTFEIYDPVMAYGAFLVAWFSGCAIGMALYALKPWAPAFVNIFQMIIQRANMIASGKKCLSPIRCRLVCFKCSTGTLSFTVSIKRVDLPL